jgi:cytochrome c-type biogenesis protein CcmH/NrfF
MRKKDVQKNTLVLWLVTLIIVLVFPLAFVAKYKKDVREKKPYNI